MSRSVCLHGQDLILDYGDGRLLDSASFQINNKDRIAIIGRNGAGKSTLMKIMQGHIKPDSGVCRLQAGLVSAQLQQDVPENLPGTVHEWVSAKIHNEDAWDIQHLPEIIMDELKLDPTAKMAELSGGTLRRALLAKALVEQPDILFLDEPTNHLDIDSIRWLEQYLQNYPKALVFVTHDRIFMQNLATRIFELDRGKLLCWDGSYHNFLKHKQMLLEAEETSNALFDKKLAEEEKWIRQGIKARRTRNEGRVRALKQMRQERSERRNRAGNIKLTSNTGTSRSKQVFVVKDIDVNTEHKTIFKNFSTVIERGEKIGIIGKNGCGKTTLIKALLGQIEVKSGQIQRQDNLKVAYFDQHRQQLDLDATALDAVAEGSMSVTVNGVSKHIISYLQDFMFTPQKARSKVRVLSGGERNRLLLAKILLQPCDVLVMDEPTNDLDIESLELLEEFLANFTGTLLIVSHDRALLNNVVSSCLVFTSENKIENLIGGYDDAMAQLKPEDNVAQKKPKPKHSKIKNSQQPNFRIEKQISKLTRKIEKVELEIEKLHAEMAAPDYFQQEKTKVETGQNKLKTLETELQQLYTDWENIENT